MNTLNNVLFVYRFIPHSYGGMESHANELIKICEYTLRLNEHQFEFLSILGKVLASSDDFKFLLNSQLGHLFESGKVSTIFLNDLSFIHYAVKIKAIYPNLKIIFRSGGNDIFLAPVSFAPIKERQKTLIAILNDFVDIIIVNSEFSFARNKELGINPNKMVVVRGGVNLSVCKQNLQNRNRIRSKRLKPLFQNDAITFVFACRYQKFKGIIEFLSTLSCYPNKEAFNLLFIGDGELEPQIEQILHTKFKAHNYCLIGPQNRNAVLEYIACCDYLINTSINDIRCEKQCHYIHTETMGRSMMEALCQNVPVIATNVGAIPEVFEETKNAGYLITDFKDLHKVFDEILSTQSTSNKPQIETPDYSWTHIINIYKSLIK